jgi:hypothetical protein
MSRSAATNASAITPSTAAPRTARSPAGYPSTISSPAPTSIQRMRYWREYSTAAITLGIYPDAVRARPGSEHAAPPCRTRRGALPSRCRAQMPCSMASTTNLAGHRGRDRPAHDATKCRSARDRRRSGHKSRRRDRRQPAGPRTGGPLSRSPRRRSCDLAATSIGPTAGVVFH